MVYLSKLGLGIILFTATLPFVVSAQTNQSCLREGYTIETINGVFTDENGAILNRDSLKRLLPNVYLGEKLTVNYLLNPSHLGGLGDLAVSVYQKLFESETVADYDLVEMLKDASAKVQTQKLLLVAHSQGNFYANSFYDTVADKEGGVPAQSIGIYSVANPASRVAGNGKWMTSDTDHVIAGLVQHLAFFRKIMPTNEHIAEVSGGLDPSSGHDLTTVYLKYRSAKIVAGIQASLDKLSVDAARSESALCIDPPKLSLAHKIEGAVLAVADPVATVGVTTVVTTVKAGVFVAVTTVKAGVTATVWTYHAGVTAANWTYDTAVAIGNSVTNTTSVMASTIFSGLVALFNGDGNFASNNSAAVILATQPQGTQMTQTLSSVPVKNQVITVASPVAQPQTISVTTSQKPQAVFVFEPKVQTGTNAPNAPKLVFVGSFTGGATQQVLGATSFEYQVIPSEEVPAEKMPVLDNQSTTLTAPTLSASQCAQTFATDGCLVATTTVNFEWAPVSGADHYLVNKNGEYATTTDTSFEATIKDFSDYTFEVVAVDADGHESATSTQTVSVATIPVAINEIAWMGTVASATDEWFELKNNTGNIIDLSQWEINAKDGTPHVKLAGAIAPHAYIVFERTNDNVIADISAHQIYTGSLGNKGEQLNLSYASTTLDQTPDTTGVGWAAGENSTSSKQTMERYSSKEPGADPTNWGTNLIFISNGTDADGNPIDGTPGERNSVSYLINKGQDITSDTTLSADDGPYITMGTAVAASTTLTLEPGVEIKFYDGGRLFIEGALDAAGTATSTITFTSFDDTVSGGISIWNSTGTTTIDNARIENTMGIDAYGKGTVLNISNTEFLNNTHAVELYLGAKGSIASSTITNSFDNNAISVFYSDMTIASTTIDGVVDGSGVAISGGTLTIASSTIRNVSDDGIALYYATSTISNVTIEKGGWSGIDIYGGATTINDATVSGFNEGAGIEVYIPALPVVVTGGEISGNAVGVESYAPDAVILDNVDVHDNGASGADDIVVW